MTPEVADKFQAISARFAEARKMSSHLHLQMAGLLAIEKEIAGKLKVSTGTEAVDRELYSEAASNLREQEQVFHDFAANQALGAALCRQSATLFESLISQDENNSAK